MLTRAQVARRLGRSIATVRRMEGRELNPTVDERGVHRFDEREVDEAAEELSTTGRRAAEHPWDDVPTFLLERRLADAEAELQRLRAETLSHSRITSENRQLKSLIRSVAGILEELEDSCARRMDRATARELQRLVDTLSAV